MLIFEKSRHGRKCSILPECDVPQILPEEKDTRKKELRLPELSEPELSRHYTQLAKKTRGVNDGFYPLGSCTMKYNPRINEQAASLAGFTDIHPLQPEHTVQGSGSPRRIHRPSAHESISQKQRRLKTKQNNRSRFGSRHQPCQRIHGRILGNKRSFR